MVGDEEENCVLAIRLKKEIIFLYTMEEHGPENCMAYSCFFVVRQSLWAWGFACIKEQVGCDDLAISKRIKLETGVADVPKSPEWECTFIQLFPFSEIWSVLVTESESVNLIFCGKVKVRKSSLF